MLARFAGTLVFLMGVGRLAAIANALIAAGKDPDTPAAVVASGTLPAQRTVTAPLSPIASVAEEAGIQAPAVTVVGHVAGLRDGIAWAEARPLHGRTIAVTRARAQASTLVARLRDLGARVVECPTIRIEPIEGEPLRGSDFDLVCLTSPNAPRLLLDRLGGDARSLAGCRVAAVGPGTAAALRDCGIVADVVAERSIGEGLVEALGPDLRGVRVLVARAEEARDTLPEGLRAAGALVEVVPLYRTLRDVPRDLERRSRRRRRVQRRLDRAQLRGGARRPLARPRPRDLDRPGHQRGLPRARHRGRRRGGAARPRRTRRGDRGGSRRSAARRNAARWRRSAPASRKGAGR